jgi:uncharacterized protein
MKKHFFLKLNPPRASFVQDMTDEEKAIMGRHVQYWHPFVENGTAIVLGPVLDPNGPYGVAVVAVDDEKQVDALIAGDPASTINTYEIFPMMAMYKGS